MNRVESFYDGHVEYEWARLDQRPGLELTTWPYVPPPTQSGPRREPPLRRR